ncbi:MAG TPA: HAMP domain-containing sensor histidine kinase [Gemmatimonadales bacterium]|nr:HAMP domain-containing sensor histidine kinase [Gemmatimonadales bacterium]
MSDSTRPPRPRALFVAALLLLTLVLAGVLALQAHRTFLDHRATAERVLRDNARLAAARFAQRVGMELYYTAFWPAVNALSHANAGTPGTALPAPTTLAMGLDSAGANFLKQARYTFRYDLATRHLETSGGRPSPAARTWLVDTLPVHVRTVYDTKERLAAMVRTVDGMRRAIVYTVAKDKSGGPGIVLGVEGDPAAFGAVYTMGEEKMPLLPRPLTGGVIYDSLGSAIVTDVDGSELYRSTVQYEPTYAARDSVEAMMGGMPVHVSLRPDIAPKLLIGGMPRDQRPRLLILLALTAGLVAVALQQLRREYELARLRADFVSGVSHELRTPLAQIRMFSETLLLGRVRSDEERERSLEIIDQEARRLTHLVENLLHFSRSERRLTRLSPTPAPLAPLLTEAAEAFTPLAAARGVTLCTELTDGVVAPVDADALRQMLLNLLDNAVKYGPAGQTVTLGLTLADGRALVSVDDQGPGIPAAERERIWDRFWRLERDRGSAVAGTGIGLSVVRELVALHGGRAWAEDAPVSGPEGRTGSRFVIELPLVLQAHATTGASPLRADAGASA